MKLHNNEENINENQSNTKKRKFIDREKAKELTLKAAKALDDKKLENIVILDLDGVTTLSDYFILATASSSPQMKAGSNAVYKELKEDGVVPYAENDNDPESLWYLTDYGFLVVHIFTEEGREYYDLDKLWHEAKKIDMN
ncbi:ribosome silencing factor [Brachyspira pulli]|uniref:ribosome silencing factor n=1 Tax=Brachyspira pulli TaxID=310721 RepID=UPI0026237D1C|nr:ribosome silencing factor [uncultured Brachyspira sp.]